ncbi:tRNA1(Val) A37 N6-methylase TrmN6 [Alkalibacter saccharofermentans DSM 14828]|uniref:tRNA1(Val) A37 N6-methylase TrmN6 n=1 Tax=Alkalibacter saccharofermentans DSM 14828 TaxID=1120975 RepID=A0A1M4TAF5_9FIRM|nr:tRNA1(Val) A37 N6-methylase TrmN6 [Alkalibacter saccharofermentans DSM 14828]
MKAVDIVEKYLINAQERVDNLHIEGLKIIQNEKFFRYGTDAVLLAWMAGERAKPNFKIADLGTGSGIIPILLANNGAKQIHGLEIQEYVADMAKRSVALNRLEDEVKIVVGDIKNPPELFIPGSYDIVVSNPPYMNESEGFKSPVREVAIARHEILCSMGDVSKTAARLLKDKSRFYLVHKPHRIVDIFCAMREHGIEPKQMIKVRPHEGKEPNMILIEGVKGGNPGIKLGEEIVVYNQDGTYTEEILKIYKKVV